MADPTTQDVVVALTQSAARQVQSLLNDPAQAGKALRVYVEQGGCSGMQYGMTFDQPRADDTVSDSHGVSVLVDPFSAGHLRGTVVDFLDDLNESGFKMLNPNARQNCGCGKSFET